jgi:hypothetical protein
LHGTALRGDVAGPPSCDPECIAELCEHRPPPSASIFLRDGAHRKDALALRKILLGFGDIESVEYFSQKEARKEFDDLYPEPELFVTGPPTSFPASLRVRARTQEAVERLQELEAAIVDEVRSTAQGLCAELASTPPPPLSDEPALPEGPPPTDEGREDDESGPPTDLVATLRAAECALDPPESIGGEPDPSVKWCSFEVGIENVTAGPIEFDWDARLLLEGDGGAPTYSTALFTGRLSPRRIDLVIASRERVVQDLHFEVDAGEIPMDLVIPYEDERVRFRLDYDCARDLGLEPYARCEFGERGSDG